MTYERLSAQDTVFLRVEKPNQPQHVGSLSLLDGGPLRDGTGRLRIEDLRASIDQRLHRVPRLRQRLMFVPYGQGRPVWVDDDHFDIEYHVRLTALPRPGDERQLVELMGRLQSQALDRDRPLWEMWFVDGVAGDRVGLVIKVHHALGDGIANVELAMALVDVEPHPPVEDPAPAWTPRSAPTPNQLLADSIRERLARPAEYARVARGAVQTPRRAGTYLANLGRAVATMAVQPEKAPWNLPVTHHRRWAMARVSMATAQRAKQAAGVTLNDVVVAACTAGLRAYLQAHGDDVDHRTLNAMVPVSRRLDHEHGETLGNRVSLIIVELPVDEPDPVRQLERVHEQTSTLKGSGLVDGAEAVTLLADQLAPFEAPITRFLTSRIPMNLVITNVPGPPVPLWLQGARLQEVFPYVEVVDNEGLTIAVVSYEDQLGFGITADRDVIPDLALLAEAIEKAFADQATALGPPPA